MIHLQLNFLVINESLQVGDTVFYLPTVSASGGFEYSNQQKRLLGTVVEIGINFIRVLYDNINNPNPAPSSGDYIMFAKNNSVNTSGIKGYYAEVGLVNNAVTPIELFSIGAGVSESSK
tara:strand:- start:488 stop:844 length:357 start_codon:yes stop_codon:yes gene_type:complete